MEYWVETRWGGSEDAPSKSRLCEILAELDTSDPEHPDTWMGDDSGWIIAVNENRNVVLSSPDETHQHMLDVPRERALELWLMLAEGRIEELKALPWQSGLPPRDRAKEARLRAKAEAGLRNRDRAFYERLGEESKREFCRAPDCKRGRVALSVFCRRHQFENVRKYPCPFDD